jgi:DNA primase
MELSGKSFIEAAETLAAQCGVTIPETAANPEAARVRGERTQMLAINKLATQFFAETLASPRGAPGRAYLDTRASAPSSAPRSSSATPRPTGTPWPTS